ncbi:MAG: hypothetical protein CVV21_06375 [Candidatus Goldiibacteriota bacterium HGW-Goldbacteria-1]|jgi:hypothetical protein|nr:MAG: hypothetical protein CVV21_06375 [Candidatus Goldiibacteriota bacterium HGW-Goldbacteria-1]
MNAAEMEFCLDEKHSVIEMLYALAVKQNEGLIQGDIEKVIFLDEKKRILVEKMDVLNSKIKGLLKAGKPPESIKNKVKTVNGSFEKLLDIEKKNDFLVSETIALNSGKHVKAYSKLKGL